MNTRDQGPIKLYAMANLEEGRMEGSLKALNKKFEERASAEVHAFSAFSDANTTDEVER